MKTSKAKLEEIYLDGSARITCPPELVPAPGQYLAAHADGSNSPLPVVIYPSLFTSGNGFRSAPSLPVHWQPGLSLTVRGPLGHGFSIPQSARKIALVSFEDSPGRLMGLIALALKQNAEIVLVGDLASYDLPEVIEAQPLKALLDVLGWADYAAMDSSREKLSQLKQRLAGKEPITAKLEAQVLVHIAMPCVALADCGVCSVSLQNDWKMVCKDGPVFSLRDLI